MTQNLKTRAYFMQNFMELDMKKFSDSKALTFWGLGPKNLFRSIWAQSLLQRTYQAIGESPSFNFQKQDLIFSAWDESNKIKKSKKTYWPWGLRPRNYIWATWAQNTYPPISPEPCLQFSPARPHFLKNNEINLIKSCSYETSKKLLTLGHGA